jgi:hypothetical protein
MIPVAKNMIMYLFGLPNIKNRICRVSGNPAILNPVLVLP